MNSDKEKSGDRSRNTLDLTYLDVEELSRYVTGTGKILPRRITRMTSKQQRHLTKTIKRSRNMLLMK